MLLHYDGTPLSAAALTKQFGFYPGDYPEPVDHGATRRTRPRAAVISASDFREISCSITGMSAEEKRRTAMREDREERHRKSVAMVKNWENTIAGQRRLKLQARQRRLEAEEAERVRQDEEWAAEEAQRRRDAIARARQLQFFQRDSVREFHSRVLLNQVLREQDRQRAYKAEAAEAEREVEEALLGVRNERLRSEAEAEERSKEAEKNKAAGLAREQRLQALAKREEEVKQIQRELEEGTFVRALDEEYARTQKEASAKRRQSKIALQLELLEMATKAKEEKEVQRQLEKQEDQRRLAWVKRKEKQARTLQQIQNEWFREAQKTTEHLGEQQARLIREARTLEEKAVERRAKEAEKRNREREERQKEAREKRIKEIKDSYEEARAQNELKKKADQKQEQKWKEQYAQEAEEERCKQEERRKTVAINDKKVQEFLLRQMEQARQNRQAERAAQRSDDWRTRFGEEDRELDEYARSLLSEPWAQDPTRPLAKLYPPAIRARLGLLAGSARGTAAAKRPPPGPAGAGSRPSLSVA